VTKNDRITKLKTTWLRALISIAETGSTSRTAPALGLNQSVISRHLQHLNEWAGRPITAKDGSDPYAPFTLTDEGVELLAIAKEFIAKLEAFYPQSPSRPDAKDIHTPEQTAAILEKDRLYRKKNPHIDPMDIVQVSAGKKALKAKRSSRTR
jgi:molybdenum-dependent DNA-binding transcriptional regulator ModE